MLSYHIKIRFKMRSTIFAQIVTRIEIHFQCCEANDCNKCTWLPRFMSFTLGSHLQSASFYCRNLCFSRNSLIKAKLMNKNRKCICEQHNMLLCRLIQLWFLFCTFKRYLFRHLRFVCNIISVNVLFNESIWLFPQWLQRYFCFLFWLNITRALQKIKRQENGAQRIVHRFDEKIQMKIAPKLSKI